MRVVIEDLSPEQQAQMLTIAEAWAHQQRHGREGAPDLVTVTTQEEAAEKIAELEAQVHALEGWQRNVHRLISTEPFTDWKTTYRLLEDVLRPPGIPAEDWQALTFLEQAQYVQMHQQIKAEVHGAVQEHQLDQQEAFRRQAEAVKARIAAGARRMPVQAHMKLAEVCEQLSQGKSVSEAMKQSQIQIPLPDPSSYVQQTVQDIEGNQHIWYCTKCGSTWSAGALNGCDNCLGFGMQPGP